MNWAYLWGYCSWIELTFEDTDDNDDDEVRALGFLGDSVVLMGGPNRVLNVVSSVGMVGTCFVQKNWLDTQRWDLVTSCYTLHGSLL